MTGHGVIPKLNRSLASLEMTAGLSLLAAPTPVAAQLTLDVLPADSGSFELKDDGISHEHERGRYRLTRFAVTRSGGEIVVRRELRQAEHRALPRRLQVRVHDIASTPQSVRVNGRVLPVGLEGYLYDRARRLVTVRLREDGRTQEIRIR